MSQNPQKPKIKIEPKLESTVVIRQPMVRNFSTGGGHLPGDTLVEGDQKIVTKSRAWILQRRRRCPESRTCSRTGMLQAPFH